MGAVIMFWSLVLIFVLLGCVLVGHLAQERQKKEAECAAHLAEFRRKAENDYQEAKRRLREFPTDAELRQIALQTGRVYYASLRPNNQLTAIDEQMLANDLAVIIGSDPRQIN